MYGSTRRALGMAALPLGPFHYQLCFLFRVSTPWLSVRPWAPALRDSRKTRMLASDSKVATASERLADLPPCMPNTRVDG